MRVAIIEGGVVANIQILPDGSTISADKTTASVPASYVVEPEGAPATTVNYTAMNSAPSGGLFVATDVADIGWAWSSGTGFTAPAATSAQLIAYASAKQARIMDGGTLISIGSGASVECSTDPASLVLLQGAAWIAAASPSQTFSWVPSTGSPVTLTAAQITAMFAGVSAFIQSTFTTLAGVIAAITAGTITTTAQVDTPPSPIPAWPANS
jgi:hypothetical protein